MKNNFQYKNKEETNKEETITYKMPLFDTNLPFIYLKISAESNRYRISTNYEFLNKKYNLKINYIRDLSKIDDNNIFQITNNNIVKNDKYTSNFSNIVYSIDDNNFISVDKYTDDVNTSMYIFRRVYKDDVSISVFFVSDIYFNLNAFLQEK